MEWSQEEGGRVAGETVEGGFLGAATDQPEEGSGIGISGVVMVIDNMESQGREAKKRFASKPFGFKTWNMRNWLRRIGPLAMWGAIVELPGIHNYLLRSLKIGIRRNVVIFHKKLEVLKGS
ncbi:hypothetical protein M9H77_36306 [Catharanthus roseus]|uniref:Uncharacterized protein n=1 Tax=Catharanthus roseus TaxID=4058 RepID=A0ACB9ZRE6_CATRO|nr:hypothetical protein M9H77_36306 [Catharanthus roseus]